MAIYTLDDNYTTDVKTDGTQNNRKDSSKLATVRKDLAKPQIPLGPVSP